MPPYNEQIETRVLNIISNRKNTGHRRMFGGVCHLLNGNMFCGVYKDYLILRLGEENANEALTLPHVKPFDITGKPMKGWVMVAQDGFRSDHELTVWLDQAEEFARSLPPK